MTTLVYHTAEWCQPCKKLKPVAKAIADELGVEFREIDVDTMEPVVPVMSVPTVAIFEGSQLVQVLTSSQMTKATLRKALSSAGGVS